MYKNILIVKKNLAVGGTETLTVRMCNWLVNNDFDVYLLLENLEPEIVLQLDTRIKVLSYNKPIRKLINIKALKKFFHDNEVHSMDLVFAPSSHETPIAVNVSRIFIKSKVLIGVYHPMAYVNRISGNKLYRHYIQKLLKTLPSQNVLFMNQNVLDRHKEQLNYNFSTHPIWPLPITIPRYIEKFERSNVIISIGNLKGFKTYNLTMLDVIRKLIDKGYDIKYEIYGEGKVRRDIEERIEQLDLKQHVFLKGQVAYTNYTQAVRRGFVFVGVGTALLEAAAAGVPSISAVSFSDKDSLSFGFVHELTGYNLGTPIKGYPYKKFIDLIEKLINADDASYEEIRRKGYVFVKSKYDNDMLMRQLLEIAESAKLLEEKKFDAMVSKLYWLYLIGQIKEKVKFQIKQFIKFRK